MSFILTDIANVFKPVTNVFSGAANAITSPFHDVSNALGGIANAFVQFGKDIAQVGIDIANFITSIPGAIISAFDRFGTWLYSGISGIGSAIAATFGHIASVIESGFKNFVSGVQWLAQTIYNALAAAFTWLVQHINQAVDAIGTFFNNIHNIVSTIIGDVVNFFSYIGTALNNFHQLVDKFLNFITTGVTDLYDLPNKLLQYHNDSLPFNLVAQEASRLAQVTDQLLGFNFGMEVARNIAKKALDAWNLKPLTRALFAVGAPILGLVAGELARAIFTSVYPIKTSQVTPPPHPTKTYTVPSQSTYVQPTTLSKPAISPPNVQSVPTSFPSMPEAPEYRPRKMIGVTIVDVMNILSGNIYAQYGAIILQQQFQILEDTLGISETIAWKLVLTQSVSVLDLTIPTAFAEYLTYPTSNIDTVSVSMMSSVTPLYLPQGNTICLPPSPSLGYSGYYSGSELTVNDIDVAYELCINISNVIFDEVNVGVIYEIPKATTIASDDVNVKTIYKIPTSLIRATDDVNVSYLVQQLPSSFTTSGTYTFSSTMNNITQTVQVIFYVIQISSTAQLTGG